ncbi:MAG: tetratricopeptide repeat protein [Planctomycetes bacterium]|nr:tetratricopeptide repeat protein [Planctomycetota bacterium]
MSSRDTVLEGFITTTLVVLCAAFGCEKRQTSEETLPRDDSLDIESAIGMYSDAIQVVPKHAEPYYSRAVAHLENGDVDRAIVAFTEAIRQRPTDGEAYYNRGSAYLEKAEAEKAIADFSEVIRLEPDNAKAFNNRGIARYRFIPGLV